MYIKHLYIFRHLLVHTSIFLWIMNQFPLAYVKFHFTINAISHTHSNGKASHYQTRKANCKAEVGVYFLKSSLQRLSCTRVFDAAE